MPYSLLHIPVEGVTAGGGGRREGQQPGDANISNPRAATVVSNNGHRQAYITQPWAWRTWASMGVIPREQEHLGLECWQGAGTRLADLTPILAFPGISSETEARFKSWLPTYPSL